MSYDDGDSPEHRNAIKQLARAREKALEAIHMLRAGQYNRSTANLIPAPNTPRRGDETHMAADATGYVCDYLTHLKPFGLGTDKWQTGLGLIEIRKTMQAKKPGLNRGHGPTLRCTRMPYLNINDMSAAIRAGNTQIIYAEGSGDVSFTPKRTRLYEQIRVQGHELTATGYRQLQSGTDIKDCEHVDDPLNEITDFEPASRGGKESAFKFVYTADQLLTLYEVADEIAAAENLLANIETPDYSSGGKGAV